MGRKMSSIFCSGCLKAIDIVLGRGTACLNHSDD
jgi:hypothetical protein